MRRLALAVIVPVALALGAAVWLRRDLAVRNLEMPPPDMVRTRIARSGGLTDLFPDGIVQRVPPEGSISHDASLEELEPGLDGAKRAGESLPNPLKSTPEVLARGATVFAQCCACCHGAGGLGDAPVTKRGFPPPPSLLRPESKALKDGEIFHAITFGRKNMPSAALQTPGDDRWRVIHYLRSLQEPAK
jgi:mono/diheme cytochrome c family protein